MSIDEALQTIPNTLTMLVAKLDKVEKELRTLKHGERLSYNLQEAAKLTGIDASSLRLKCKAGKIPYSQEMEGGTIIIKRKDLERYLDEHNNNPENALADVRKGLKKSLRKGLWKNSENDPTK